jgi:hypothetical protein
MKLIAPYQSCLAEKIGLIKYTLKIFLLSAVREYFINLPGEKEWLKRRI